MRTRHDHTGQHLPALTRLLHDLAWDMPPGSQRLKDHLNTELQRAELVPPGCRAGGAPLVWAAGYAFRAWLAVCACATVAGATAAAIAISITSQDSLPPPSPAAIQLLAKVASAAARQPTPHPTVQIWPVSNVCRTGIERFTLPNGHADNQKFSVAPGSGTKCVPAPALPRLCPALPPPPEWHTDTT